jgi:hypothetical protein
MAEVITITSEGDFEKYKKLQELIRKTQKAEPKSEDVAALRKLLDEHPAMWRAAGNMAQRTLSHVCRLYFQDSSYAQECVLRRLNELRADFGYEAAPPLERLLIEQVLVCYVNLYALEINAAGKLVESHSTETGLYWDRRLIGAQRRFVRATESLARLRRLAALTLAKTNQTSQPETSKARGLLKAAG